MQTSNLLEIKLVDDTKCVITPESSYEAAHNAFCKLKETLTRIGTKEGNTLRQECYVLHRRGKYYLCHFNQLKHMDGEEVKYTVTDIGIRNKIAEVLSNWNMIQTVEDVSNVWPKALMSGIMVIPFKDVDKYELISPYNIGVKR
ncbi:tranalstional repressor [Vibrio phage VP-1]|uniref:Translation repressor protein n=1 Tax=Vibrio phage VP-1 TaxID=2234088 RepID=A0A4P2TE99_9CAUD|nr:tranalstional repressor [Vibrio phage VP-1]